MMNQPYEIIPISLGVILLYLTTRGLVSVGEIHLVTHKRIWNTILLTTFLIAALLGLLLAIQVNYKLEITWIKKALQWHVNVGIALAGAAFVHLSWHLSYYFKWRKAGFHDFSKTGFPEQPHAVNLTSSLKRVEIILALVILGFTSILAQLIIIREFLNVFQGNELIIGMIFCAWMLLTATGSRLGNRLVPLAGARRKLGGFFLLSGLLPAILVALLYFLENRLFLPGTTKGFLAAFLFCSGLLLPFCLLSGILYTLMVNALYKAGSRNSMAEAYGWESAGGMAAGLIFSLLLAFFLSTYQMLAILILLNLFVFILLYKQGHTGWKAFLVPALCFFAAALLFSGSADKLIRSWFYKNQELVFTRDTPYGNVTVTKTAGQLNFYTNGGLLFSTENKLMQEEAVHFTLLQHPRPASVLIVSGGQKGMAGETSKYPSVNRLDYCEINPWLLKAEALFTDPASLPFVKVIRQDARRWIKHAGPEYDVMLINTPDPSNAQINRYYTIEFFGEAKHALRPGGIFSISLASTANYLSEEARSVNQIIYHSLKSVFQEVEVIQGERNYFIASDGPVHLDIARRLSAAGIENEYVQPGYIEDDLLQQRNRLIMDELIPGNPVLNSDLRPIAYLKQVSYWLSIWQAKGWIIPILMLILMLVIYASKEVSSTGAAIFAGGFAGASIEFLLLMVYQVLYGYVYQMLGLIVACYMIGLTAGSLFRFKQRPGISIRTFLMLQVFLLLLVGLIPLLITCLAHASQTRVWIGQAVLLVLTLVLAGVTGLAFNLASKLSTFPIKGISGGLYSIDLAGAASGTLLVSLLCFPAMGLYPTFLLIAMIVLAGIIVLLITGEKTS